MATYFSTFITGFTDVIQEVLTKRFEKIQIEEELDGMIVYSTFAPVTQILEQKYFNNTFVLLASCPVQKDATTASIVKDLYRKANFGVARKYAVIQRASKFRISISRENELTSINNEIVKKIEEKILSQTPFKLDRQRADYEFWFVIRSEGKAYLGMRITKLKAKPEKGQLRPELAQLLCALSNPAPEDIFLDPCAGSGAIVQERLTIGPFKQLIAGDSDPNKATALKFLFKKNKFIQTRQLDVANLYTIEAASINKIVTDPPWGLYDDRDKDYSEFYTKILLEFKRVLIPNGIIVVLTARKEEFKKALTAVNTELSIKQKLDILVSGKKASIYVLSTPVQDSKA